MHNNNNTNQQQQHTSAPSPTQKKPNDTSGVYFSSSIKIFDPNTKEILVHKRGDS